MGRHQQNFLPIASNDTRGYTDSSPPRRTISRPANVSTNRRSSKRRDRQPRLWEADECFHHRGYDSSERYRKSKEIGKIKRVHGYRSTENREGVHTDGLCLLPERSDNVSARATA